MLICGNGILVYSFSTLTALLLDWIIGAAFHGMTGIMAAQSLLAWFVEQLAFIAMYQVALVAVMLTGNILTALLGCAVFFSYELAVRFLIDELKTMFFASYCSADARQWMQKSYRKDPFLISQMRWPVKQRVFRLPPVTDSQELQQPFVYVVLVR